jgi:hypothetical protein
MPFTTETRRAGQDGWIGMFDVTLSGWQANEHAESWKVVDGAIVSDGPASHVFRMVRECDDCEFRATDCTDPNNRYAKGYLALQQHSPGSIVQFRSLLMRPRAAGK